MEATLIFVMNLSLDYNWKGLLSRRIMPIRKISTKPLTKIAACQCLPVVYQTMTGWFHIWLTDTPVNHNIVQRSPSPFKEG